MTTPGSRFQRYDPLGPKGLPVPTPHAPGSAGKIAELCRRVDTDQQLWHPDDNHQVRCHRNSSRRDRVIDYVAALTSGGPLLPLETDHRN